MLAQAAVLRVPETVDAVANRTTRSEARGRRLPQPLQSIFFSRRLQILQLGLSLPSLSSLFPSLLPYKTKMEDVFDGAVGIDLGTTYS